MLLKVFFFLKGTDNLITHSISLPQDGHSNCWLEKKIVGKHFCDSNEPLPLSFTFIRKVVNDSVVEILKGVELDCYSMIIKMCSDLRVVCTVAIMRSKYATRIQLRVCTWYYVLFMCLHICEWTIALIMYTLFCYLRWNCVWTIIYF